MRTISRKGLCVIKKQEKSNEYFFSGLFADSIPKEF